MLYETYKCNHMVLILNTILELVLKQPQSVKMDAQKCISHS